MKYLTTAGDAFACLNFEAPRLLTIEKLPQLNSASVFTGQVLLSLSGCSSPHDFHFTEYTAGKFFLTRKLPKRRPVQRRSLIERRC